MLFFSESTLSKENLTSESRRRVKAEIEEMKSWFVTPAMRTGGPFHTCARSADVVVEFLEIKKNTRTSKRSARSARNNQRNILDTTRTMSGDCFVACMVWQHRKLFGQGPCTTTMCEHCGTEGSQQKNACLQHRPARASKACIS